MGTFNHYYKVNAWLPRNYVIINKGIYEGLSDNIRNALHKAADETGAHVQQSLLN